VRDSIKYVRTTAYIISHSSNIAAIVTSVLLAYLTNLGKLKTSLNCRIGSGELEEAGDGLSCILEEVTCCL